MSRVIPVLVGWVLAMAILVGIFVALTFWTDRTLDFWLSYFKEMPIDVPWYLSALATLVSNGLSIPVNVVSEIARLCL
jgi:hypothetical protein